MGAAQSKHRRDGGNVARAGGAFRGDRLEKRIHSSPGHNWNRRSAV